MDASNNGPAQVSNPITGWVWYEGTDAIKEGEGVCFNTNYGTATERDGRRSRNVERPSTSNNTAFAGVAARNYAAESGGQFIEINEPGSKNVMVALGTNPVIDTGILTFQVGGGSGAGRFVKGGFLGRGSIVPRETIAAAILETSMTGAWSLAADGVTLTVVSTTGLLANDTVVLLGGENDGTGAITAGKYVISSITSSTVLVLTASAVTATTTALTCTGYAYTGNPRCQADLLTGDESGGIEFLSPLNTGSGTTDVTFMAGGVTYVLGGVSIASADCGCTLADGTKFGEKKGFGCLGTIGGSYDLSVSVTTGILQADGGALSTAKFDAADEEAFLTWWGAWIEQGHSGATLA